MRPSNRDSDLSTYENETNDTLFDGSGECGVGYRLRRETGYICASASAHLRLFAAASCGPGNSSSRAGGGSPGSTRLELRLGTRLLEVEPGRLDMG